MWEVAKEMYTQYYLKNDYIESCRNFSDDYANIESKEIDMTLSGIYLYKYPKFKVDLKQLCLYPSKYDAVYLIEIIKKKFGIRDSIVLGSGSNGILQNIIKIILRKDDNLVTPYYTFNQAEYAATALGCITRRTKCDNYKINFEALKKSIDHNTKIVYLCNPNNPTGIYVSSKRIIDFAREVESLVVVDESGIDFTKKKSILEYKNIPNNLIVLRSFSKAYGLANMRIGYMCSSSEFAKYYMDNTTINEYSGLSISFAINMLDNYYYVLKNVNMINKEKNKLINNLKKIGIDAIHSDSNTIMSKTIIEEKLIEKLFYENVSVIKVYDEFNNVHFRIAVQDIKSNNIFLKKIYKIIKENNYD